MAAKELATLRGRTREEHQASLGLSNKTSFDGYGRKLPSVRRLVDVIGAERPNLDFKECEAIARDVLKEIQQQ